ncbi:kinase-like domain-containing protein [Glomus cerebriforme]|uniref:mitogen-activated protein kinase kinase n=1 Tax=Glomus cerebriforme TaxID=658196 RepID=A0A397SC78_9GLOM|nr:kinase-like domain-containing protein [Glomus cerebriforme]
MLKVLIEAKLHLTIANKCPEIVKCHGLTQDPSNGNYMLVMRQLDTNLRTYLQENNNQLKWKERIKITVDIIEALLRIHNEKSIHRDLHSGNIFIYGNLPYIAPEVIVEKKYTLASDIYSIAMLMWEISSGQPPFANYENGYDLAMNIVNGLPEPRNAKDENEIYNNPNLHSEDQNELEILDVY